MASEETQCFAILHRTHERCTKNISKKSVSHKYCSYHYRKWELDEKEEDYSCQNDDEKKEKSVKGKNDKDEKKEKKKDEKKEKIDQCFALLKNEERCRNKISEKSISKKYCFRHYKKFDREHIVLENIEESKESIKLMQPVSIVYHYARQKSKCLFCHSFTDSFIQYQLPNISYLFQKWICHHCEDIFVQFYQLFFAEIDRKEYESKKIEKECKEELHPVVDQPNLNRIKCFPHQLTSIYYMEQLEREHCFLNEKKHGTFSTSFQTKIGILGDIPGYGKTISILGLIQRDQMPWDLNEPFFETLSYSQSKHVFSQTQIEIKKVKPTLIIVPASIFRQWEKEIKRTGISCRKIESASDFTFVQDIYQKEFRSQLHPQVLNNLTNPSISISLHNWCEKLRKKNDEMVEKMYQKLNETDIVLCSATMYNKFIDEFPAHVCWKRCVFDETDTIAIPNSRQTSFGFLWFLSATYKKIPNVRNRGMIEYCIEDISEHIPSVLVKNDDEYVAQSFSMPQPNYFTHRCLVSAIANVVEGIAPQEVFQMIVAGDVEGAIERLGGRRGTDNIVQILSLNKQKELREAEFKLKEYEKDKESDNKSKKERYLLWLKKKEGLCVQLENIKKRFEHVLEENECSICQEKLKIPTMVPCCQNIFCVHCISPWVWDHNTCPMCRHQLMIDKLIPISNNEEQKKKVVVVKKAKNCTKPEKIVQLIQENPKGKFIIFSDFDASSGEILLALEESKISCCELKGTAKMREKILANFTSGKCNVLFLNSIHNGAGINMVETTDIIFYHQMNLLLEMQLVGRANRIGRNERLRVHTLVHDDPYL